MIRAISRRRSAKVSMRESKGMTCQLGDALRRFMQAPVLHVTLSWYIILSRSALKMR